MKWISVLLAVFLLAGSVGADTLYTVSGNDFDEFGFGIDAVGQRVAMSQDGDIILMLDRDATAEGMYIYLASAYGGTVGSALTPWNVDAQRQSGVLNIADSFWVYPSWANSTYPVAVRKYVNGSLVVVDTLGTDAAGTSGGDRGWISQYSDYSWFWYQDQECGSPDSAYGLVTGANFGSIGTPTAKWLSALLGSGVRRTARGIANVGAGIFVWDHNGEDIRWVDSLGTAALSLDVTGGVDLTAPGFGFGKLFCYGDSNIALTYSNGVNAGGNGLWVRAGHATSGVTGSPTAISWHSSAVNLVTAGTFPDAHAPFAQIVYLRRDSDSMWCFFRQPDNDSMNIMMSFSGDAGISWTAPVVRREGHNAAQRMRYLQMSEFANIDDTCIWFSGTFSDSADEASEAGYIWVDTIRLGGGGGGPEVPGPKRHTGILLGSASDLIPDAPVWAVTLRNEFMIKEGE